MAVVPIDGRVRVYSLTACANVNLPTVAELNAGTQIGTFINPDGLDINVDTGKVPAGNVTSKYTLERVGRIKPTVNLTCHHDASSGATDPLWNLFVYRATGFLAVRTGIDTATAWATGQGAGGTTGALQILPYECAQDNPVKPAEDTAWDFTIPLTIYLEPGLRAVVA